VLLSRSVVLAGAFTVLGAAPDRPGRSPDATDAPAASASKLRLELNVPAYRLDVFLSDALLWSYTVAVGPPRYPTPVREFETAEIVWNSGSRGRATGRETNGRNRRGRRTRWGG